MGASLCAFDSTVSPVDCNGDSRVPQSTPSFLQVREGRIFDWPAYLPEWRGEEGVLLEAACVDCVAVDYWAAAESCEAGDVRSVFHRPVACVSYVSPLLPQTFDLWHAGHHDSRSKNRGGKPDWLLVFFTS